MFLIMFFHPLTVFVKICSQTFITPMKICNDNVNQTVIPRSESLL